ncbi:AraC family ligand binding domain-containing protein [Ferrovibrio sp.]|uniref:AraC family transcriptional regulator n=1 Tax=Ferrovibrio sp. TaxID=1917215 RepID=UPI003511C596
MAHPDDWFQFARDPGSGTEMVRAAFHARAYDPHFHDQVLVGVTEQGRQHFRYRRQWQHSRPGRVILMEPGETHDGEAGDDGGFTYSMLYFDPAWLLQAAGICAGRSIGPGLFDFPRVLEDSPALAAAVFAATRQIAAPDSRMHRDAALDAVVAHLLRHGGRGAAVPGRHPRIAARIRDAIEAHLDEDLGLDRLAALAGTDRFRLHRSFQTAYGLAPHAYLVQRRLNRARQLLAQGATPADAAAAVGFADQSHLGRWFRRAFGMTPAAYRRACTNLPDIATP